MQRSQGLAALFLAGTFLIGGALGFAADRVLTHPGPQMCGPGAMRGYWDAATKEWGITPAQRVIIDSLLDVQHGKVLALYDPMRTMLDSARDRADALSDSTLGQIRLVLTPSQQAKMDEMRKDARERAAMKRACRDEALKGPR
jgi:Spy/CpxP family protein refolding chaperone